LILLEQERRSLVWVSTTMSPPPGAVWTRSFSEVEWEYLQPDVFWGQRKTLEETAEVE
jgi:hypothetical protein